MTTPTAPSVLEILAEAGLTGNDATTALAALRRQLHCGEDDASLLRALEQGRVAALTPALLSARFGPDASRVALVLCRWLLLDPRSERPVREDALTADVREGDRIRWTYEDAVVETEIFGVYREHFAMLNVGYLHRAGAHVEVVRRGPRRQPGICNNPDQHIPGCTCGGRF